MQSPAPDPIALLLAEHDEAAKRFAAFDQALAAAAAPASADASRRALDATGALLAYLDSALELHIRKEEGPLFPRLKARLPADDRYVDELVAEHDQARIRREELRAALDALLGGEDHHAMRREREAVRAALAAADLTALRAAGQTLLRTLRVHFQNEEELAFPLARDLLSPDELGTAGWEMLALDREGDRMDTQDQGRTRPPGETAGSAERPAQRVAGAVLSFDLTDEVRRLQQEPAWRRGDRTATTLVKQADLRVVLTALKAGAHVARHQAPGRLTIHTVQGRLRVTVGDAQLDLAAGGIVALDRDQPHDLTAVEDSAFLLTISWPAGPAPVE